MTIWRVETLDGWEEVMEWNGMEWNGMEWGLGGGNGILEWNGIEYTVDDDDLARRDARRLGGGHGMEWNGMEWSGGWEARVRFVAFAHVWSPFARDALSMV